jgi:S1-C subfamily serine protease
VQINTPIQPGNSGGPVIDDRGLVIGVVVSKLNALRVVRATGDIPQNVNFAIGLRSVQTFLEAQSTKYTAESDGTKDISASSERASAATVRVMCLAIP